MAHVAAVPEAGAGVGAAGGGDAGWGPRHGWCQP